MYLKRIGSLVFLFAGLMAGADPVKILIVSGGGQVIQEAKTAFDKQYGAGLIEVQTAAGEPTAEQMAWARISFYFHPEDGMMQRLTPKADQAAKRGAAFVVSPTMFLPRQWVYKQSAKLAEEVERYWQFGGVENITPMLALLYQSGGGVKKLKFSAPVSQASSGIYHPKTRKEFKNLSEYLAWYETSGLYKKGSPLVGIGFFNTNVKQQDLAHIDALIAELERNKIGAVPAFGWPFHTLNPYFTVDGKSPLRLIYALNLGVLKPDDTKWLESHGVHAMNLQVTRQTYAEWSKGLRGLMPDKVPSQISTPERAATAEPILFASTETRADGTTYAAPVRERVEMTVKRSLRWIALQDKPNPEKKIVFVYYNNPPGKGNLGASYLQVLPTMSTLLERLRKADYVTGDTRPSDRDLIRMLERSGRNVETWAPGELDAMLEKGGMVLYAVEDYKRHFAQLPLEFRNMITKEYGPPEKTEMLRIKTSEGKHFFVIPGARYGNVFMGVQPLRATFDRIIDTTHDTTVPVPHSYVAAYMWYRHVFKADAIVHIGRHGTLEWLPGKQVAQAGWDHSEAMLGDIPNPYYYIMDGDGESLQAMRRSAAVMISHLTPLILGGGMREELRPLNQALEQLREKRDTQATLADQYWQTVKAEAIKLKLDTQLRLNLDDPDISESQAKLMKFVGEVLDGPIPAGIHSLGVLPSEAVQKEALGEFIKFGFQEPEIPKIRAELPKWAEAVFEGREPALEGKYEPKLRDKIYTQIASAKPWITNLRLSATREVDAIVEVLRGRYLPSSPLGEPLRVPAGLPTGRKQFGFDPTLIPTKEAWALGRQMADETLARFRKEKGGFPDKVSMMLWYGETDSHHGAMESMALHLMGIELQWNARNQVDNIRLIPDKEMKHPRVNVVFNISGIYRDGFGDKINLLDRASRLAASAGDNAISRHDKEVAKALIAQGVDKKQAERIARARVFGNKPGSYSIGVDRMVESSRDAGNDAGLANLYLHYMNSAFSEETWGEEVPKGLEEHLKGNQSVLFSRTSNLYGVLDNDDTYSYAGGMSAATKFVNGGKAPEFYIHNLRKPGAENMVDLKTFLATEMNQRLWNPKWIEHMKGSGYAGAREMFREVEHLYGFQATTKESMEGSFWQNTFDVYVADKHGMELEKFFEKENPHARQNQLARMLEVDRQGSYKFNERDKATLVREYVKSVAKNGVACSANTCGNQKLQQHVAASAALVSGLGDMELKQFGQVLAKATRWAPNVMAAAPAAVREGMKEAQKAAPRPPAPVLRPLAPRPASKPDVTGFAIKETVMKLAKESAGDGLPVEWGWLLVLAVLLTIGAGFEARKGQVS